MTLIGVNLPTLGPDYDHDLAPNQRHPEWPVAFSPMSAYRHLAMARQLGFQAVRIWLCENQEGLITGPTGLVEGVHPQLIEAVRVIQDGAHVLGLQLYWTLLDANSWPRNDDQVTGRALSEPEAAQALGEAIRPLVAALAPDLTLGLEVVNEPESASLECWDQGLEWAVLCLSIQILRQAIHTVSPGLTVTAGTQAVFLPGLLSQGPIVDAIDLHAYHPDGGLPSRSDLPAAVGDLPLWAGEAGLHSSSKDGKELEHYLYNARELDYQAIFLWKMEGELASAAEDERGARVFEPTGVGADVQSLLWGWRG